MKAAKEKRDDRAVEELQQEAEKFNHYITIVPQYKEESTVAAAVHEEQVTQLMEFVESSREIHCPNNSDEAIAVEASLVSYSSKPIIA